MFMSLFFIAVGFTFYKLFLSSPFESRRVIKSNSTTTITNKKAADFSGWYERNDYVYRIFSYYPFYVVETVWY